VQKSLHLVLIQLLKECNAQAGKNDSAAVVLIILRFYELVVLRGEWSVDDAFALQLQISITSPRMSRGKQPRLRAHQLHGIGQGGDESVGSVLARKQDQDVPG